MTKRIIFAGGCFWGVEAYFKRLKGVIKTSVGYIDGNIKNPQYEDLIAQRASHAEACEIIYDDKIINLLTLLEHLFRIINPYSLNKQGGDIGIQYRSGVYYQDEQDYKIIKNYITTLQSQTSQKIVVEVKKETAYYLAEEYHQDYLDKNPSGYCHVDLSLIRKEELKNN